MIHKFSQSSKETIQKAQAGDETAVAQVIEENMGLITNTLIKWGYTPKSEDFEDVVSDIKVEMLSKIIPRYDFSRGAFSTFLTIAINNFLKNIVGGKKYREKQQEISLTAPIGEEITIEDILEAPVEGQITIGGAREHLQNWFQAEAPDLEDIILRIFDLKVEGNSNDRIVEILNEEGYTSRGKPVTHATVKNYVNKYIKSIMQYFLDAFKSAFRSVQKKAGIRAFPSTYSSAMDLVVIVGKLKNIGDEVLTVSQAEELADSLYGVFVDDDLFNTLEVESGREGLMVTGHNASRIIGERLEYILAQHKKRVKGFPATIDDKALEVLEPLVDSCKDPTSKIEKVPLEEMFNVSKDPLAEELAKEPGAEIYEDEETFETKDVEKQILPETERTEETIGGSYAELFDKYTEDEIWDIASGKKTDVTEEEIAQAKDAISKGVVARNLGMRKKANVNVLEKGDFIVFNTPGGYAPEDDIYVIVDGQPGEVESFDGEYYSVNVVPPVKITKDFIPEGYSVEKLVNNGVWVVDETEKWLVQVWGLPFSDLEKVEEPLSTIPSAEERIEKSEQKKVELFEKLMKEKEKKELGVDEVEEIEDEVEEVGKQISPETERIKETIEVPYSELLNKYTEDEIWDITAGRKTDVTEEEIAQAKYVIQQGIVASRLGMRKRATVIDISKYDNILISDVKPFLLKEYVRKVYNTTLEAAERMDLWSFVTGQMGKGASFVNAVHSWAVANNLSISLEETIELPYADLLHTYTDEEIWDIASGRKTDVTEEEIEAAKYVISKGIVANRLSMRKKGKDGR